MTAGRVSGGVLATSPAHVPQGPPQTRAQARVASRGEVPPPAPGRRRRRGPTHATQVRPRRVWPWLVLVPLALLVAGASWILMDLRTVRAELLQAAQHVAFLRADVVADDDAAAATDLAGLREHAAAAHEATQGPHWAFAERLPWVGTNVDAVQTAAAVIDDLADGPARTLLDALELAEPARLVPVEGRVDLAPFVAATPSVAQADAAVQEAAERLAAVDRDRLWDVVDNAFGEVLAQVNDLRAATSTAARVIRLLPPMLGAQGPRHYLLLVEDAAQVRASGGAPAAALLVRAEDGVVSVVDSRPGAELAAAASGVELSQAERDLFGDALAAGLRDVGATPDFPRTAELAREVWLQHVGGTVDGVLAVDGGALALVVGATGPVPLPPGPVADVAEGRLTAENAVGVLGTEAAVHLPDPVARDAFVAQTASSVLGAVVAGPHDPTALVTALADAARQGRLRLWSADPDEQALLAGTVTAGELRGRAGDAAVVGAYVNETAGTRMGWYLDTTVALEQVGCLPDGGRQVAVTVTLRNVAPADAGATLPPQVTGGGAVVPAGEVAADVLVYAPAGGVVESLTLDGEAVDAATQEHAGLAVARTPVRLAPGEQTDLTVTMTAGTAGEGPVLLRTTPLRLLQVGDPLPARC